MAAIKPSNLEVYNVIQRWGSMMFCDDGDFVEVNPIGIDLSMKYAGIHAEEKFIISQKLLAYASKFKDKINGRRERIRKQKRGKK